MKRRQLCNNGKFKVEKAAKVILCVIMTVSIILSGIPLDMYGIDCESVSGQEQTKSEVEDSEAESGVPQDGKTESGVSQDSEVQDGKLENGITYKFNDDTAVIVGYEGTDENVVIPSAIDNKTVVAVGYAAFKDKSIKTIELPEGIVSISDEAFYNTTLTRVSFPHSLESIGVAAFAYCEELTDVKFNGNTKIDERAFSLTGELRVDFGNGNISIGQGAFWVSKIKEVNLTENVIYIGNDAFQSSKLENVTIAANVTELGISSFYNCTSLKRVDIVSTTIKTIGEMAFKDCKNLNVVRLPKQLESIGNICFENCNRLTVISLGDCITNIGDKAFGKTYFAVMCGGNEYVKQYAADNNINYSDTEISEGEVKNGKTDAGMTYEYSGDRCVITGTEADKSGELTVPSVIDGRKVIAVGENVFANNNYDSIVIENGVTYIGNMAFYKSSVIKNIELPESVVELGVDAFTLCNELQSVKINGPLKIYINNNAFSNCYKLETIDFGNKTKQITENFEFSNIKSVVIPESVEDFSWSFNNCATLEKAVINSNAKIINRVFYGCTGLKSVKWNGKTKIVSENCFSGCTSLTSIELPDSVEMILGGAFSNCDRLTYIKIPAGVEYISDDVFANDTFLTIVGTAGSYAESYAKEHNIPFLEGEIPDIAFYEGITEEGKYEYYAVNGEAVLTKCTSEESNIVIPSKLQTEYGIFEVKSTGKYLFRDNENIVDVTIEDGVERIAVGTFFNCRNIKRIDMPESIHVVDNSAFYGCSSLEKLEFTGEVSIYGYAFEGCSSLKEFKLGEKALSIHGIPENIETLYIPSNTELGEGSLYIVNGQVGDFKLKELEFAKDNKITRFPYSAFENFYKLESVVLSDNLEQISMNSFANCICLKNIILPEKVSVIDTKAFYSCETMTGIYIPETTINIADDAFDNCYFLTISAPKGSYAIEYAKQHGIKYIEISANDDNGIKAEISGDVIEGMAPEQELPIISDAGSMIFDPGALIAISHRHGNKNIEFDYKVVEKIETEDKFGQAASEVIQGGGKLMDFSLIDEDGNNVLFSTDESAGTVTITIPYEAPVSANKVTVYYIAPDGTKTDMNGVYSPSKKMITFTTSHFSYYAIEDDSPDNDLPAVIFADANSDGTVNSKDVVMMKKHLAGIKVDINLAACDVNADGKFDSKDVVKTMKKLAGYDVVLGEK